MGESTGRTAARGGDRPELVWAGLLTLLGAVLCFLPLGEVLGFEFSLVLSLAAGLAGAHLAAVRGSWAVGSGVVLRLLLLPLALITLNTLRVKNCNYWDGFRFYLLLAGVAAVVGGGWGRAAGLLLGKPGRALGAALVLGGLSVAVAGYEFFATPTIRTFGAAYGWWPGALYDEALGVPAALAWSRLQDLALAGAALAAARLHVAWRAGQPWRWLLGPLGLALLPALALGLLAEQLGFATGRSMVERRLAGVQHTSRLELHYPRATYDEAQLGRLVEELTCSLEQVESFFGLPPDARPVRVYVYESRRQRQELMGADRVSIAKPWLREVHLIRPGFDDPVARHELAHVVAGRLAPGPWHLPVRWGLLPQMGLIEGAAVAAEWDEGELTAHGWSAAMRRAGLAPAPLSLLQPTGFYARAAAPAYTVAGSFVRFLVETRGPAAFARAYASGDLRAAYDEPPAKLQADWEGFLAGLPQGPSEVEQARLRFQRASIFRRVCAREIARQAEDARGLAARGQYPEAAALGQRICHEEPGDPAHLLRLLELQAAGDLATEARWTAARLLDHPQTLPVAAATALERLGDLAWHAGDLPGATWRYSQAAGLPLPPDRRRSLAIKGWALAQGPLGETVRDYLTAREGQAVALLQLAWQGGQAAGRAPRDPEASAGASADAVWLAYLVGRALHQRDAHPAAIPLLELALAGFSPAGPEPEIRLETLRLLGRSLYLERRLGEAEQVFLLLAAEASRSGWQAEAARLARRCRWAAAQQRPPATAGAPSPGLE
ncbi:MAG: hypothetical protein RBU45_19365 [Myxococcota bacterium]|jgi:hypothetical protein|nr:hypothetical protein [Myxococcota bacterium]